MSVSRSGLLLPKTGLRDLKTSLCFTVLWLGRENHILVRLQGGGAESPKHPCYLLRQPSNKSPCHLLLGCYNVSTLGVSSGVSQEENLPTGMHSHMQGELFGQPLL